MQLWIGCFIGLLCVGNSIQLFLQTCWKNCPSDYQPLCARNKQNITATFTNLCKFSIAECKLPHSWTIVNLNEPCANGIPYDEDPNCEGQYKDCYTVSQPLCGKNLLGQERSFASICRFKQYQCGKPEEGWHIVSSGRCPTITATRKYHCPTNCPTDHEPICGKQVVSGQVKIFLNECEYDRVQCAGIEWNIVPLIECQNNPSFVKPDDPDPNCHQDYQFCDNRDIPTCGRNKDGTEIVFQNMCQFKQSQCLKLDEGWQILADGLCPNGGAEITTTTVHPCPTNCPVDYEPVCGKQVISGKMKIFLNDCEYDREQCSGVEWDRVDFIECKNNPSVVKPVDTDPNCLKDYQFCDHSIQPTCGRDIDGTEIVFENFCRFKRVQCQKPDERWEIVADGLCPSVGTEIATTTRNYHCPTNCPTDHEPVCGKQVISGRVKIFLNDCEYDRVQCADVEWNRVPLIECQNNPSFVKPVDTDPNCLQDYESCDNRDEPTCGRNMEETEIVFQNICRFKQSQCLKPEERWEILADGLCPNLGTTLRTAGKNCPTDCPTHLDPVCGKKVANGIMKIFSNDCEYERGTCADGEWERLHIHECHRDPLLKAPLEPGADCEHNVPACDNENEPICGKNIHGTLVDFQNICQFKKFKHLKPEDKWEIVADDWCASITPPTSPPVQQPCPTDCSDHFEPVCGKNEAARQVKIFFNECKFERVQCNATGWQRVALIECHNDPLFPIPCDVDQYCEGDYRQCDNKKQVVCGRNKKGAWGVFPNICQYKQFHCFKPQEKWKLISFGPCMTSGPISGTIKRYDCPATCPAEVQPICGKQMASGEVKLFRNDCEFAQGRCESEQWTRIDLDECYNPERCSNKCPKVYRPVCAIDSQNNRRQFPNRCSYNYAFCKDPSVGYVVYKGKCGNVNENQLKPDLSLLKDLPLSCFGVCSYQYAPFCAVNSGGQLRTFANQCEQDFEVCNNRDAIWKSLHDGECTGSELQILVK